MFLQDIAVKLNDFGVLVQLLVVDFFKFCFRNANDDKCVLANNRHFHLYLSHTYDRGYVFKFEVFDTNGNSLRKDTMSAAYPGATDYHMRITAAKIGEQYPEIKGYIKELQKEAGWADRTRDC